MPIQSRWLLAVSVLASATAMPPVAAAPAISAPMSVAERQRVLAHLEMTETWLVSELEGLSDSQLTFKMRPESWSITDVVEHLAIAEPQYWAQLRDSLQQPEGYESPTTDLAILWYGVDRTERTTTGEARVPKGKFASVTASLAAFRTLRDSITSFARDTPEDLRARQLKGGNMDLYQWLLMISTHSQRHIMQIREVKAHAGYPKK